MHSNGRPLPDPGEPPIRNGGKPLVGCLLIIAFWALMIYSFIRGCLQ
jgi:hypothetical protein